MSRSVEVSNDVLVSVELEVTEEVLVEGVDTFELEVMEDVLVEDVEVVELETDSVEVELVEEVIEEVVSSFVSLSSEFSDSILLIMLLYSLERLLI